MERQNNLYFLKPYTQAAEVFPWTMKGRCNISTYSPPWSSQWGHAWPRVWWSSSCLQETPSASTKEERKTTIKLKGIGKPSTSAHCTHREVKLLRLLLVGPSFGQTGFAQIGLTKRGLDGLHAVTVVKAFRHIVVFHCHHVLDGAQSGLHCFLNLMREQFRLSETDQVAWVILEEAPRSLTSSFSIFRVERRDCSCWHLWSSSLSRGCCAHTTPICAHKQGKKKRFLNVQLKKKITQKCSKRTGHVPCLPYGTGNQSELGGKRHYCRSPSVSACLHWLPDSPWPPPASPGPSVWTSLHSVQQTSRSSGLAAGWHGSQGHSTVTHKHTQIQGINQVGAACGDNQRRFMVCSTLSTQLLYFYILERTTAGQKTWKHYPTHNRMLRSACVYTHVNDVGQVVDVIFEDAAVCGLQCQQVFIPSLDGLQPVLCVFCLSLIRARPKNKQSINNRGSEIQQEWQKKERTDDGMRSLSTDHG